MYVLPASYLHPVHCYRWHLHYYFPSLLTTYHKHKGRTCYILERQHFMSALLLLSWQTNIFNYYYYWWFLKHLPHNCTSTKKWRTLIQALMFYILHLLLNLFRLESDLSSISTQMRISFTAKIPRHYCNAIIIITITICSISPNMCF